MAKQRFFKLVDTDPSDWGWDTNPEINVAYSLDELQEMYGEGDCAVTGIISTWEDEEWEPKHGKWVEVEGKEESHV